MLRNSAAQTVPDLEQSRIRVSPMPHRFRFALLVVLSAASSASAQQPATLKARAPELEERPAEDWINSKPLMLSELRGRVVILHFWTFGCINCQHNFPTLKAWQKALADKAVTIIGVHTPETDRERQVANVRAAVKKYGLKYPIVFDKDAKIWKSWDNRWWPSTYLIDKQGFVRYRWDGEFNWKHAKGDSILRRKIEQLLAEDGPATAKR
jgi:thiol-disulfide isomerase/thioredoxin